MQFVNSLSPLHLSLTHLVSLSPCLSLSLSLSLPLYLSPCLFLSLSPFISISVSFFYLYEHQITGQQSRRRSLNLQCQESFYLSQT